jgi:DNA-binding NarL/FixJ family response regulator
MAQLLLINEDSDVRAGFETALRGAGHEVVTVATGKEGLHVLTCQAIDIVLSSVRLLDKSSLGVLDEIRASQPTVPCVLMEGCRATDALIAVPLHQLMSGPMPSNRGVATIVQAVLDGIGALSPSPDTGVTSSNQEAHAAARWARVTVPVLDSPTDPRTIAGWSRVVYASPGALRNWCRMAGVSARPALVFARLLRAVWLKETRPHGDVKAENVLDVVDRRTLVGLFRFAGLDRLAGLPADLSSFLDRQILVRDPDMLSQLRRAIAERRQRISTDRREATATPSRPVLRP